MEEGDTSAWHETYNVECNYTRHYASLHAIKSYTAYCIEAHSANKNVEKYIPIDCLSYGGAGDTS